MSFKNVKFTALFKREEEVILRLNKLDALEKARKDFDYTPPQSRISGAILYGFIRIQNLIAEKLARLANQR